jgi:DNA-binding LacI/PurR family transcriptional regulator
MADVARAAGVSHQTVSRVLNDHPNVRPATRDRVLAAIAALGYRPNPSARALVTRQTLTVGVVAYDTTLYGPASTLQGVERATREAGYAVSLSTAETVTAPALWAALDQLRTRSVDGIVLIAPRHAALDVIARLPADLPAVVIESGDPATVATVRVDQEEGGRLATGHLLSLGHPTVFHVAGPEGWAEAEGRLRGWRSALEGAGAAMPDPLRGDWSPRSGYVAGWELAARGDVSAVFVANDHMALGVLRAFGEHGIDVPGDVSVVGFDDIPEAAYLTPPLTTVRQDFAELGRRGIHLLLAQVEDGRRGGEDVVPARLVVRRSTAPLQVPL